MDDLEFVEEQARTREAASKEKSASFELKEGPKKEESQDKNEDEKDKIFIISDLKKMDYGFWIIAIDCMLTYGMCFSQTVFGTAMMRDRFGFKDDETGAYVTSSYLVSTFMMPIFGKIADTYGYRVSIMFIGGINTFCWHFMQLCLDDCDGTCWYDIVPYIMYGFSLAIYMVIMWGSLSFIVPEKHMG